MDRHPASRLRNERGTLGALTANAVKKPQWVLRRRTTAIATRNAPDFDIAAPAPGDYTLTCSFRDFRTALSNRWATSWWRCAVCSFSALSDQFSIDITRAVKNTEDVNDVIRRAGIIKDEIRPDDRNAHVLAELGPRRPNVRQVGKPIYRGAKTSGVSRSHAGSGILG